MGDIKLWIEEHNFPELCTVNRSLYSYSIITALSC